MTNVAPFIIVVGIFTIIGVVIAIIKFRFDFVDRKQKQVDFEIEKIEILEQNPCSWDFILLHVHVRNRSKKAITIWNFNVLKKVQDKWEEHYVDKVWEKERNKIDPILPEATKFYPIIYHSKGNPQDILTIKICAIDNIGNYSPYKELKIPFSH